MNRRDLLCAAALGSAWPLASIAAPDPVEGRDYTRVSTQQAGAAKGPIEVVEFFGYWCPHCRAFEPALHSWVKALPSDTVFKRLPAAWQASHVPLQKLFFALEALNAGPEVHARVFDAVQVQHLRLDTDAGLAAFASSAGLDKTALANAMNGFSTAAKLRQADQAFRAYRLDGVPTLVINGQYATSPSQTGGEERALAVASALVQRVRASR